MEAILIIGFLVLYYALNLIYKTLQGIEHRLIQLNGEMQEANNNLAKSDATKRQEEADSQRWAD